MRIIIRSKGLKKETRPLREIKYREYKDNCVKESYTTEDQLPRSPIDYARFRLLKLQKFVWGKKTNDQLQINDREKWERVFKWIPYYDNEINHPYDVITNGMDLRMYLMNPDIAGKRFRALQLSDIRHKYLLVMRNIPKSKMRPHGKFYYLLAKGSRFPYGYTIVSSLPDYITIQYDSLKRKVRVTGEGAHPHWRPF